MVYQWYPGHMSKAKRQMQDDLKIIDAVVEILDARIPYSSKNPDIDKMAKGKARLIILNKSDLADKKRTELWKKYYESKGFFCICVNSKNGNGIKNVTEVLKLACADKLERDRKRGMVNRPIRAMVAGIPNCGKSTFINSLAGRNAAKTGNKPGVTKGKQWIRLNKEVELLDTPGILWPKFEDQNIGMRIAFIGSINDEILFPEELCYDLMKVLKKDYPGLINKRYGSDENGEVTEDLEAFEDINDIVARIAVKRSCLKKGAEPDITKISTQIINDFRSTRLGNITLEIPYPTDAEENGEA